MGPMSAPLKRQFCGALSTIRRCVEACPEPLYAREAAHPPIWHVAYHTLFYADLYLSEGERAFTAPHFHRENMNFLRGEYPHPPFKVETPAEPPGPATLIEYAHHVEARTRLRLGGFAESWFTEPSPFPWLPMSRGEAVFFLLRHTAHHAGGLVVRLREAGAVPPTWGVE